MRDKGPLGGAALGVCILGPGMLSRMTLLGMTKERVAVNEADEMRACVVAALLAVVKSIYQGQRGRKQRVVGKG